MNLSKNLYKVTVLLQNTENSILAHFTPLHNCYWFAILENVFHFDTQDTYRIHLKEKFNISRHILACRAAMVHNIDTAVAFV